MVNRIKQDMGLSFMENSRFLIICGIFIFVLSLLYNIMDNTISFGFLDTCAIAFGFLCILFGVAQDKVLMIFKKIDILFESKPYFILFIITVISFFIRLIFLPERWINPDEGAHLYDALFVLDGKIPFVDFDSRMPVYIYTLALFQKIFGCSYFYGRLFSLFANIGIGILIFLIGKTLFNSSRIALLASLIYLFSPLSILWSVVVKTELPETLCICIGMFLLSKYIFSNKEEFSILYFCGFFFALAYYVRRSAVMMLIASLLIVIYFYKNDISKLVRSYGMILLGYLSVVLIIFIYFSGHMGFYATWDSPLNPLDTIIDPLKKIGINIERDSVDVPENKSFKLNDQSFSATIGEWKKTVKLNLFLLLCLFLSILFYICIVLNKLNDQSDIKFKQHHTFLFIWFFSILFFYLYYSAQRGFFNQYFIELLPPLVLISSYVILLIASKESTRKCSLHSHLLKIYFYKIYTVKKDMKILITIVILTAYISSLLLINPSFECVWSPQTVEEASRYLLTKSNSNTEIISGAVIWSSESHIRPFLNITHPLGFRAGMSEKEIEKAETRMLTCPPQYIILDGYTEQTYIRHISMIQDEMNESYSLIKEINGSKYPVQIYEHN